MEASTPPAKILSLTSLKHLEPKAILNEQIALIIHGTASDMGIWDSLLPRLFFE